MEDVIRELTKMIEEAKYKYEKDNNFLINTKSLIETVLLPIAQKWKSRVVKPILPIEYIDGNFIYMALQLALNLKIEVIP